MNDIKKRFLVFREEHPSLGDVIIMSMAVDGQAYSKPTIQRAFNKLVSKEEYEQDEKREIVESLVNYSQKLSTP